MGCKKRYGTRNRHYRRLQVNDLWKLADELGVPHKRITGGIRIGPANYYAAGRHAWVGQTQVFEGSFSKFLATYPDFINEERKLQLGSGQPLDSPKPVTRQELLFDIFEAAVDE